MNADGLAVVEHQTRTTPTVNQLMDSLQVGFENDSHESRTNCTGSSIVLPKNEGQARALLRIPEEKRAEIWQQAVETAPEGKITAKHIQQTVAQASGEEVVKKVKQTKESVKKDKVLSESFTMAFQRLLDELEQAKKGNYKTTSRERQLLSIWRRGSGFLRKIRPSW